MSVERDKSRVDFTKDGKYQFFPDDPTDNTHDSAMKKKKASKFYDPCAEASKMSLRCLERNDYDKDKCIAYFQAYRDCKKTWIRHRRAN